MRSSQPSVPSSQSISQERISRSAGYAFSAQIVGAALTAFLTIFLGRALSVNQYGSLTFALSVLLIANIFASFGIATSTGRFLAERRADPLAAAAVFRTGLRLQLWAGLIVALALLALATPICHAFGTTAATWPLRFLALSLLAQPIFALLNGAFSAIGKVKYNLHLATIESVAEVLVSVILVVLGVAATGAALGNTVGYAISALVGLAIAKRVIGRPRSHGLGRPAIPQQAVSTRRILSYATPLLIIDAAYRVFAGIDILLIAALVGGGAPVAAFGLSMRLTAVFGYAGAAVASAVAPRLASWRDGQGDVTLYAESLRYLLILQMLLTAPLVIWSKAITHLIFGSKYPEASTVLQALVPYVYLLGIAQLTTRGVNYLGEARRRVPIATLMLSVNVAIDAVLLRRIGIVAGAIGTSAAFVVWVPAHLWILRGRTGLQLWPLAKTALRTCVAGGAMVGALAALGTGNVRPALMAVGLLVGPAVYGVTLFAVRELTFSDVVNLRTVVARRASVPL